MSGTARIECRCGAWWTGSGRCHCGGCHETFSGLTAFDRHRTQDGEHGTCWPPAERGLEVAERPYGLLWRLAGSDYRWTGSGELADF